MKQFLLPALLLFVSMLSTNVSSADDAPFRHAVFFKFTETATEEGIQKVVDEFLLLKEKIDTIVDIEWGTSESVEGLDGGFTHVFFVTFADVEGLKTYLPHPAHEAFVEILKPILDDVFVFDYTAKKPK